jgi:hypothetical protein
VSLQVVSPSLPTASVPVTTANTAAMANAMDERILVRVFLTSLLHIYVTTHHLYNY